jgi:hypothetical protein
MKSAYTAMEMGANIGLQQKRKYCSATGRSGITLFETKCQSPTGHRAKEAQTELGRGVARPP